MIPAVAMALIPYFRLAPKYRRTRNRVCSVILFLIVAFLAINTLAGLEINYKVPNKENEIILLVDVSDTEERAADRRDDFVQTVLREGRYDNYRVGVVTFGYGQKYAVPLTDKVSEIYDKYVDSLKDLPDTSATDIAGALTYTKSLFNYPETAKIVLITDGKETDGNAASVARSISASGIRIDVANIPSEFEGTDVQITDVELPNYHVNVGEECVFKVLINSTGGDGYTARITMTDNDSESDDGKVVLEDKTLMPDTLQEFEIPYTFKEDGAHKLVFSAEITNLDGEQITANNTYTAFLSLEQYNKILILGREEGDSDELSEILSEGDAFNVRAINFFEEDDIPDTVKAMRDYDQIILNNVSVADMVEKWGEEKAEEFQLALYRYVYDYGGSVFTVGGDDDAGDANFYNRKELAREYATPLRQMLPVQAVDYTPPLGVAIIIDRSGSMGETLAIGGTREDRLWWARAGATSCLNATDSRDFIAIMTLDSENEVILSLTPRTQRDKIISAIESIDEANGGTIATNALRTARQQLLAEDKIEKKHVIIVTDGEIAQSDTAIEEAAINYRNGITLSIVQIGGSSAGKSISLKILAAGNGWGEEPGHNLEDLASMEDSALSDYEQYLYTDDDKIIYNMREDLHQHGIDDVIYRTFKPVIYSSSSPLVQGLGEIDPHTYSLVIPEELEGFYGTKAKDDCELILVGEYDVPVYAQWKFGKGMVGSFMCDIGGKWGSSFSASASGREFIKNAVGNLLPTEDISEKGLVVDLREENYVNQINVFTDLNEGETVTGRITDISTSAETVIDLSTPADEIDESSQIYVLTGFSKENSYSRSNFVIKKSGVYKIEVIKKAADGSETSVVKYKTFSYSKEYDLYSETEEADANELIATVAARGNGSVIVDLEDPVEIFKNFVTEIVKTYDPRVLFMILTIILFLLNIIVRKFKFLWPHEIAAWVRENKALKKK